MPMLDQQLTKSSPAGTAGVTGARHGRAATRRISSGCGRAARAAGLGTLAILLFAGVAAAADGGALYRQHCAACHGAEGRGGGEAAVFVTAPPDLRALSAESLVQRIIAGRATPVDLSAATLGARAAYVEPLVAYVRRMPDVDWPRADAGAALFADRCALCHGPFGTPPANPPPGVRPPRDLAAPTFQAATSPADLIETVRHGRRGMPGLTPRLSEGEAADLATFVRLLSPGHTTYAQNCANCHGDHGIPSGGLAESAQPPLLFDRAWLARQDPEVLRRNVWHMLGERQPTMPHFATLLTEDQARAIAHLLAAPK